MSSHTLLDRFAIGVVEVDLSSLRVIKASVSAGRCLGIDMPELRGAHIAGISALANLVSARDEIADSTVEEQLVCRDGTSRWLKFAVSEQSADDASAATVTILIEDVSAAHEAAMHHRQALERLRLAECSANFGIFEYSVADGTVHIDSMLRELLGEATRDVMALDDFMNRVLSEDRPFTYDALANLLNSAPDSSASHECRISTAGDQSIRWILITGVLTSISEAELRVTGIVQDITRRRHAEEIARERDRQLTSILAHSKVVAWMKDSQQRLVHISDNFARRWNLQREDWFGKTDEELWPHSRARRLDEPAASGATEQLPNERMVEIIDRDGVASQWLAYEYETIDERGRAAVGGVAVDVTKIKNAEQLLQRSELRLQKFLDNSSFVAFVKDRDGRYVYMSEPFKRRFMPSLVECKDIASSHIWQPGVVTRLETENDAVLSSGRTIKFLEQQREISGKLSWWMKSKFPIVEPDGNRYVGCLAIDVTEHMNLVAARDELREMLHAAQTSQEQLRVRFARDVHDAIGAPLSAVKALLHLAGSEKSRTRMRMADIHAQLLGIVSNLLEDTDNLVAWLRPPELDHLGLEFALNSLAGTFTAVHHIECTSTWQSELPPLRGDLAATVYRIVQESLANVAKHAQASRVTITCVERNDELLVEVEDNGRGIAAPDEVKRRGFGLLGCREQALAIGGQFVSGRRATGGFFTCLRLPLPECSISRVSRTG